LVAGSGWICCGGDRGDVALIRLGSRDGQTTPSGTIRADADSRLPLDLDPVRRLESSNQTTPSSGQRRSGYPVFEKSTKIGDELVNCITLWFPPPSSNSEETHSESVAVLSNNDHSVTIVNLATKEVLERLELDDCVNRAVISPDGRLLIAIGDDPYMHVYHRKQKGLIHKGAFGSGADRKFGWTKCQQVHLKGQRSTDNSDMRGSFATAFSPSGRYLAVGTQYGIISVFETNYLITPDADPLIVTFTTSRPNSRAGAVRAMEFSPEPYDLLAWTEDHGRLTVADIRHCFMSRQTITMDPRGEGVEKVGLIERSDDLVIDPRLRQFRMSPDGNSSDSVAAEMERRQLRHLSREGLDRINIPLTAEETEVLDALRASRRQREREASSPSLSVATHHSPLVWSDLVDDIRSTSNWRDHAGLRGTSTTAATDEARPSWREQYLSRAGTSSALPASLREFVGSRASTDAMRTFINERNQARERQGLQPQRRGSIILAAAGTALNRDLQESSEATRSTDDLASTRDRTTATPPRLPAIRSDSPSNPWAQIEELYNLAIDPPVDPPVDPTARMRIELAADNRREFTRRLEQRWRGLDERQRQFTRETRAEYGGTGSGSNGPLEPVETTGICWSTDGKML
jgi:hypothetical protein